MANGLIATRLQDLHPDLDFLIVEKNASLGGCHTWSFHENDISSFDYEWLKPFMTKSWTSYKVIFPKFERRIPQAYHSISSDQFHRVISEKFQEHLLLNTVPAEIHPDNIILNNGVKIQTQCVLDGRGWDDTSHVPMAYQKFLGWDVELEYPHGLNEPLLMDALDPQDDGFCFFYILPWTDKKLLIEYTSYSDSGDFNREAYRTKIEKYLHQRQWKLAHKIREEEGALAIPLEGELPPWERGVVATGSRAGLFHPTTGYSLPQAVQFADEFCRRGNFGWKSAFSWARRYAEDHWNEGRYFRKLNRLLFRAAVPEERWKVFRKFYHHTDDLIARFYAQKLSILDKIKILSGKPPVPLLRAIPILLR